MNILKIKNNRYFSKKNLHKRGFVVLFAVMLSSIILAITIGVANISIKENKFSTESRETNDAFFAADAGAECAFYNDKATINSFPENNGPSTITCFDSTITLNGAFPSWNFIIPGLGSGGKACAKVTVNKTSGSNPTTSVISKGYNVGGDGACDSTNPNLVERELQATFISESIPTVTISADSASVGYGGSTYINWSSTNATSCIASDGDTLWPGAKSTSSTSPGYATGNLTSTTIFSIQCTGAGGVLSNIASVTVTVGAPTYATGGIITSYGNYTVHTFTTSGTFNPGSLINSVDVLVVAGGGGGGATRGGGGGGGGVLYSSGKSVIPNQNYSVTVGNGGDGGTSTVIRGSNGANSVFNDLIAIGGGGGGSSVGANPPYINGLAGGSGGGGSAGWGAGTGGSGTAGQGYAGGNGYDSTPGRGGGGGGGAGAVGTNASTLNATGGIGIANSIRTGVSTYYAGGGGGGGYGTPSGGLGGGGTGGSSATAGVANTGGGGGGGSETGTGDGGSGIVIIRYLNP